MAATKQDELTGSLYQRGDRWYWGVYLPNSTKQSNIPMRPPGSRMATTDRKVAEMIARQMWAAALTRAESQAAGIDLPDFDGTVRGLALEFRKYVATQYRRGDGTLTSQVGNVKDATEPLISNKDFCDVPVLKFGPVLLDRVRQTWITRENGKKPLCRSTINARVKIIRRMFQWAGEKEIVPGSQWMNLAALKSLRRHTTNAREPKTVRPVDPVIVRETMQHMTPILQAMVELHMLTGMRSTEVCCIQPRYIEQVSESRWLYHVPTEANKMEYKNDDIGKHDRTVPLVGRTVEILTPYLLRADDAYCFDPAVGEKQNREHRRANRKTPLYPGHLARYLKQRKNRVYGARYDKDSYGRAISRAVTATNKARKAAAGDAALAAGEYPTEATWTPIKWHPHQLRHTAATIVRKKMKDAGRDAARALLGQKQGNVIDTYAEIDRDLAFQAAEQITM